jgi:hypothetical protein
VYLLGVIFYIMANLAFVTSKVDEPVTSARVVMIPVVVPTFDSLADGGIEL